MFELPFAGHYFRAKYELVPDLIGRDSGMEYKTKPLQRMPEAPGRRLYDDSRVMMRIAASYQLPSQGRNEPYFGDGAIRRHNGLICYCMQMFVTTKTTRG